MTDKNEPYTNIDLDTAENLLVAAGADTHAKALRQYTQGIRNLVQGEFGVSFVNAIDNIMAKHVGVLSEQIGGLKDGQADLQAEFRTGLSGIQETVSALAETVDGLQTQMQESQADRQALHNEIAEVKAQLSAYMAGSRRDEVAQIQRDIRELRGPEMPREQRQRYVAILLKMIAEWEASHPEGLS